MPNQSLITNYAKSTEFDVINDMIEENNETANLLSFNIWQEAKQFAGFSKTMLWAFPVANIMRWKIRKNKQLKHILQFKELLPVRNNIEKGSFAYDSLLFNENIFSLFKNKSHLANLVCLAILFGDEFIDGIAAEHGKENIRQIFADEKFNYYLQYREQAQQFELFYEFDICDVLPLNVLTAKNAKYEITYKAFYLHLLFLLKEMNAYINKLEISIRKEAAQLICKACNKCFDTYKADITAFDLNYTFTDLQHYQKTKDDDIIQVLLTLRAVLLTKKKLNYQAQFSNWSSMVRSMQLYDDMQDIAHDYNYQMNTLAYFAKNYFTNEWQWLQQNSKILQQLKGLKLHAMVCLQMPASVMLTMQYARNIAYTRLNWVQSKITNYLWRKNWLGINNKLLNENKFFVSELMKQDDCTIPLKIHFIKQHVYTANHPLISTEMKTSLVMDIMLMDAELKKYIQKKLGKKQNYFLTSSFLEFPLNKKAALAKQFL
ncbi:MAG: hypothetical protein IPP48_09855 [Chitinophagaceae bacterium]|nr:hypothetical protein [Chitinophagaceae bacterium]